MLSHINPKDPKPIESTENLYFRDTDLKIYSSIDDQLDLSADMKVQIVSPSVDVSNDLSVANALNSSSVNTNVINFSSGASITSGAGAPAGPCVPGSLYTDTTGGANTTLYVCEINTWVAK